MTATLRVVREGVGVELRRGTFEVEVDGVALGEIGWHQSIEFTVSPGRHSLVLRAGRYSSRPDTFDARDGDVVSFRCHGAMAWPRWLASALRPDLAVSLVRQ